MADILNTIKKQIEDQTRKALNVDLTQAKIVSVSSKEKSPHLNAFVPTINPAWTVGKYVLNRAEDNRVVGISPQEFKDAGTKINWQIVEGKIVYLQEEPAYTNVLAGIQVYSVDISSVFLSTGAIAGAFRVYTKSEDDAAFSLVHDSLTGAPDGMVHVPIDQNVWNTVVVTFYTSRVGSTFALGSDFSNITAWRHFDVTSPSVPQWSTPAVSYEVTRGETAQGKNVLHWAKDSNIDFAGNGIYREAQYDSGVTVQSSLPGTLARNAYAASSEHLNLFTVTPNATLNSSDSISFTSGDITNVSTISRVIYTPKNHIKNPVFKSKNTAWTFSEGTMKADAVSRRSGVHFYLSTAVTVATYSITSTLVSTSLADLFFVNMYSSANLMDTVPYNADGYKANPSRWTQTGLSSIVSTLFGYTSILRCVRSGDAQVKSQNAVQSFYMNTAATYSLSIAASSPLSQPFSFSVRSLTDATLFTSPTLLSNAGFIRTDVQFTPSVTASAYFQLNIPATTPAVSAATIDFGPIFLDQYNKKTGPVAEWLQIKFYDQAKSQLGTIATLLIDSSGIYQKSRVVLGTLEDANQIDRYGFPATASYFSVGYLLDVNSTGTTVGIERRIHGFAVATTEIQEYAVFATTFQIIRTVGTVSPSLGNSVYVNSIEHLVDRPRQTTDGAIITWDDFNIIPNITYGYYLDSYDSSAMKNRSGLSALATVLAGDTVAPKAPTNYALTGQKGGFFHQWTNPTAADLRAIRIYEDSDLVTLVAETIGRRSSYVLSTLSETVGAYRFRGNLLDDSNAGNHITTQVGITSDDYTVGYTEDGTTALNAVSGEYSFIATPVTDFDMGTNNFTVEVIAQASSGVNGAIVYKLTSLGGGDYRGYQAIMGGNVWRFQVSDGGSLYERVSVTTVDDDTWHYMVAVVNRDTDKLHMYVDGVEESNSPGDMSIITGSITATNAAFQVNRSTFVGLLDEVVVTKGKALTATQINSRYKAVVNSYTEYTTSTAMATRYVTAVDTFGNESSSVSATATALPLGITDLGFSVSIRNAGGDPIYPNENGWYNQSQVTASISYFGVSPIASYFYSTRSISGLADWSSFFAFNGLLGLSANIIYGVRFKVKDIYDNESAPSDSLILPMDNKQPAWTATKSSFWNPDTTGLPGMNYLSWDNSQITDTPSGKHKIHIARSETAIANENPAFELSTAAESSPALRGWTYTWNYAFVTLSVVSDHTKAFYGDNVVKLQSTSASGDIWGTLHSSSFAIATDDVVTAYTRVAPASMSSSDRAIFMLMDGTTVLASVATVFNNVSATFEYLELTYTTTTNRDVKITTGILLGGGISDKDYMYIGEGVALVNAAFTTIEELPATNNSYYDDDVAPWKEYTYRVNIEDQANNISTLSDYIYARTIEDTRDKYRNLLDNSSFERVTPTTSRALIQAENWEPQIYTAYNEPGISYPLWDIVQSTDSYDGGHRLEICSNTTGGMWQHKVNLLPFSGQTRNYVFSAYIKLSDTNSSGYLYFFPYNKDNKSGTGKSTYIDNSTATTTGWTRVVGTWGHSLPSIVQCSLGIIGGGGIGTIYADAFQLEEKDSLPPRPYYDTKSITADYIQGNFIRGHMIEADSIYANHMQVDSIAASNIQANTITTNELNLTGVDIFTKNLIEGNFDFYGISGTIGNIYITLATNYGYSLSAPRFNYIANMEYSGINKVYLGFFHPDLTNGGASAEATFLNYNAPPAIAKPYPFDATKYGVVLIGERRIDTQPIDLIYGSPTMYSSFCSLSNHPYMSDTGDRGAYTTPQVIATFVETKGHIFRYNSVYGNFYYMTRKCYKVGGGDREYSKISLTKLSPQGTLISTYIKSPTEGTDIAQTTFEITPGGTLLTYYTMQAGTMINCVAYSTMGAVVTPTIRIPTYSGFHDQGFPVGGQLYTYYCSVARATLNKYILSYSVGYNMYYKIITPSGTILTGKNTDLYLTNMRTHPRYDLSPGTLKNNLSPREITTWGGNVLFYMPAPPLKDDLIGGSKSIGGKAIYFARMSATIALEDLLNRIS